ncbi:GTPase, partial [Escherichia coli]
MNPSDAIEAIEKPLSSLPYSLSRHILEHLRKLTSHEPVIGIMGKSGAGKSSLCNALFQGEVTPVSDVHAGTREVRKRLVRTVLIFTESSDQLSRATDRVPGLPASPG